MKPLFKLALLSAAGVMLWKGFRGQTGRGPGDDRGPAGSSGIIRDAGPDEQEGIDNEDWDLVDEQSDESFPASDPPGNF